MAKPEQYIGTPDGPPPPRGKSVEFPDSIGKLIKNLASVSPKTIFFQGKPVLSHNVDRIILGASLIREFRCIGGCTACCAPFTIDYTPMEFELLHPDLKKRVPWKERDVDVNGEKIRVFTFNQASLPQCPYLTAKRPDGGLGCALWPHSPLECAAAPQIHFISRKTGSTHITKQPFSRGWRFIQKPQCAFIPQHDPEKIKKELQKNLSLLYKYLHWAAYLKVDTRLDLVVSILNDQISGKSQRLAWDSQAVLVAWRRSDEEVWARWPQRRDTSDRPTESPVRFLETPEGE